MIKLVENMALPREGFFWIIDNKIIGYSIEVPQYNYEYQLEGKTHQNTWESIKPDGCDKPFDYYPRGRVMVDPTYDNDNKFDGYYIMIFADECIKTQQHKDMIIDYYNLDVSNIKFIKWMNNLKQRAGIEHYSCHGCRNK